MNAKRFLTAAVIAFLGLSGSAFAQGATAPATSAPAPVPPPYVVVTGEHNEGVTPRQQLTVLCPATHRAFGVGYAALLKGKTGADGVPGWRDTMLDSVRTMPDSAGTGFLVEGFSAEVERTRTPWRLVVRVVCVKVAQ